MLTQSKPAGQFVRADLTVTECQKREESSLLKSSFNEDLSRLMTATKMSVLCQSNALRSLSTLSISICFYCLLWCLIEANVKQLFGKKTACMLYADPSAQLRDTAKRQMCLRLLDLLNKLTEILSLILRNKGFLQNFCGK